jgi:hypothetical protein
MLQDRLDVEGRVCDLRFEVNNPPEFAFRLHKENVLALLGHDFQ